MAVLLRAVLVGQLHCLSEDGLVVITGQRWSDPEAPADHPVSWLRLVRNGRPRQSLRFGGLAAQDDLARKWSEIAERFASTALTEIEMWEWLHKLAKVDQVACSAASKCAGRLPVAWDVCPECGRNQRNVARGSMSGARGREVFWDLRKPSS